MIDAPVPRYPTYFVLRLLAETTMRPFTQTEHMGWQGCESAQPRYGEFKAEDPFTGKIIEGTLVVDGENLELSVADYIGEPALYKLTLVQ